MSIAQQVSDPPRFLNLANRGTGHPTKPEASTAPKPGISQNQ
jgi:hypothetical protein